MKISKVKIGFENVDVVSIPERYIGDFRMYDFEDYIGRVGCNGFDKMTTVNTFLMEIHPDANTDFNDFGMDNFETIKLFERLKSGDITSIEIELEDGTVERYRVNWDEGNEYTNKNQETIITEDGRCIIKIASKESKTNRFIEELFEYTKNDKRLISNNEVL